MSTIIHAVVGYFILLLVVRVLKRRAGAQMTMFEFVLIFLIGGTIILSTLGNDRSVTNATCAVISVGLIHRLLGWTKSRNPRIGAVLDGAPVIAVRKGRWQHEVLRETNLRREDIEAAARGKSIANLRDVDYAVVERSGQISILKKESNTHGEHASNQKVETNIPARLDRLPWSRWHLRIITSLGTSWLLDGLEVTMVGSLSGILESKSGLHLTDPQVTGAATTYLAGAVLGALLFGYLTDRFGRRKLFLVTLATYSLATIASAFSWEFFSFAVFRFFTGVGIGGEYAAINSAVDELIPGKVRGTVDLVVNGTFWLGATAGSLAAMFLLAGHLPQNTGWRYAFGVGGSLGILVLILRLFVPESPRWLMLRGHEEDAGKVVGDIEERASHGNTAALPEPEKDKTLKINVRDHTPLRDIFNNMTGENRKRSILALVLMIAQSFFFNAVFFSYALVVKKFFHISDRYLPLHLLPFAVASFFGPLVLGKLYDSIGRKPMITASYGIAGLLLAAALFPFASGMLAAHGLGIWFSCIFFVASSAASAAYLTVSEIFPLEIRAFAIAIFYAIGTLLGGVGAPLIFGFLIATGSRTNVALGYGLGAALMLGAAVCEHFIGVEAAGKSLESISKPLQSSS